MKKSPLLIVRERFESKEKLVEAVRALATAELWIDRLGPKGLEFVSNSKLLHLHDVLADVKSRFGSRAALVEAILVAEKRQKDGDYRASLEKLATPRLLDLHGAAARRAKRASATPAPSASKKKPARSRRAQAKAKSAS